MSNSFVKASGAVAPLLMVNGSLPGAAAGAVRGVVSPALINFKYDNTRTLAAAFVGALSGTLRSRFLAAGDSTLAGTGALNTDTANARSRSALVMLAEKIRQLGGNAYSNWAIGSGLSGATLASYVAYDPRVAFGSSASFSSTIVSAGGQSWGTGADATNGWVEVTPGETFDTVDVLEAVASALGTYQMFDQALVQQGGNTSTVVVTNGARQTTHAFTAGSTKARIKTTGTNVRLAGMGFRNAARPGMEIINMSLSGGTSAFYATAANAGANDWFNHNASMPALFTADTKNLYLLGGGANDINAGTTIEQLKTITRNRCERLLALPNPPEIIGAGSPPADPSVYTQAQREALNDAQMSVIVDEFGLPYINPLRSMPSHADMRAMGWGASDLRHLRSAGQYQSIVAPLIEAMQYAASLQG